MTDRSSIEWTDATWNPVTGCTKVSPGCDHCYAETLHERFHGKGSFQVVQRSDEKVLLPLRWRKPRRIFVNSMSDLFHDDVPDNFIAHVFSVMARTPHHTYQLLTKRHARMRSLLSQPSFRDNLAEWSDVWPLPNVWLGVSAEDQKRAELRVWALLDTPAAVRFVSCEPLLGPVDLTWMRGVNALEQDWNRMTGAPHPLLDWVIVGGESGHGARPMHPAWARSLRDQCHDAGIPFHFKQFGAWAPVEPDEWRSRRESDWLVRLDGYHWPLAEPHGAGDEDAATVTIRRVGKKAAGRQLDGRTWDEYPAAAS